MAIQVLMTRSTDVFVGLSERAAFANRNKATLFISFHLNAATAQAKGYEDFVYPAASSTTILARNSYHDVAASAVRKLNQVNRGKKVANFAVLRETNMPAVLVELAFITNVAEYGTIAEASNFEMLAQTHAQAIKEALAKMGKGNNAIVVLDPGHGGSDPGAVAKGYTEAAYVLRFAKRVKAILEQGASTVTPTPTPHETNTVKEVLNTMKLNDTARKDIQALNNAAVGEGIFKKLIATRAELAVAKKTAGWSDKYNATALEDMSDDDLKNKLVSYAIRKHLH